MAETEAAQGEGQGQFDQRRQLARLIEQYPGLHLRELARQADISEALAGYHMDALQSAGLVEIQEDGVYKRFYPAKGPSPTETEKDLIKILRQRVPLQIVLNLLEGKQMPHTELTARLGLAKSTVSYHLAKLRDAGIIAAGEGTLFLAEPKRIERLLIKWEPPRDLTDSFADLWEGFFLKKRRPGPEATQASR